MPSLSLSQQWTPEKFSLTVTPKSSLLQKKYHVLIYIYIYIYIYMYIPCTFIYKESIKMVLMNLFAGHEQRTDLEARKESGVNGQSSKEAYTLLYVK